MAGGTWETEVAVQIAPVDVYPHPPVMRARLVPPDLLRRIGEHTGRAVGEGVEFAAVRPYLPGDRLRDVNWHVSGRRGDLHINQRAAQRAADLIVMIDAFSAVGPRADSTIDLVIVAGKMWSFPLSMSSSGARRARSKSTRVAACGAKLAKLTRRMVRPGPGA